MMPDYEEELRRGEPFLGEAMLKDIFFSALVVVVVVTIAALAGPKGPNGPPDPTLSGANPRPDWPFLWLFALLSLSPRNMETAIILIMPVVLVLGLLAVPFVSNRGERAPSRRPVSVLSVIVIYTALGVLTYLGHCSPWSPKMTAWSGDAVPEQLIKSKDARCRRSNCKGPSCFKTNNAVTATRWKASAARAGPI